MAEATLLMIGIMLGGMSFGWVVANIVVKFSGIAVEFVLDSVSRLFNK